ncbi:MAG: methylamine methyltransferase corrinoid protein reductive activase [Candidatus Methanomethylophilaceae archaeon]|nr:methylamine methyltransferase corrinoid protein reductive activase [Candidatus Methanomethylophilaceae archaeon]MDD3379225.1 methylamine methyltransferase corrinoid protein reductive activase [Candidatus Methanomethylophilaceae archaeon]MDY0224503.1 methylamine methyltransferase corrinoid protein reductive activase [Candidatus Methanomethylophilaceae archaeon]
MKEYCIALDIGTSGLRCQVLDKETGKTLATSITQRHPIPGMNVIDHVNFAIQSGEDVANGLMIGAINQLFSSLDVDLSLVKTVAVCGNPFQLSLFQNIEIRDLAYAGKNMLKELGVVSPPRDGDIINASDIGLKGLALGAKVIIPPAVTHEIGADAIAMLMITDVLTVKEPCIVVDYGTNAEMALIVNGKIYTGSAAAGPALEGQEIERGMLAAPGAIADVNITEKGWACSVLDRSMVDCDGDVVDPATGNTVVEGYMHKKAIGITGTGVVAALYCGMKQGDIDPPLIKFPDSKVHLQDGINISSDDVDEAGKAIGALRAGFLTLLNEAGLWTGDVKLAYMSGASGLYVDAIKALSIGMVVPGAERIIQFGNTSIELARRIAMGQVDLIGLRDFAMKLRATHCMFATSEVFKNIYSIEYSLWCTHMPMSEYNNMLELYNLPYLSKPNDNVTVKRLARTDLPDTENTKVKILEDSGTVLVGEIEGCIHCECCVNACPEQAISIGQVGDRTFGYVKSDRCAGTACRRCEAACNEQVLHITPFRVQ